jgi:cofilin
LNQRSLSYIIYKLNDSGTEIIVEATGTYDPEAHDEWNYTAFTRRLPENECRWAVYEFQFDVEAGLIKRNKTLFIAW